MLQIASAARRSSNKPFFVEVAFIGCWHIWKLRNAKIFRHERPTFATWRRNFIHDMLLRVHRFYGSKADNVKAWIDGLP
jgi:hypothetical protein